MHVVVCASARAWPLPWGLLPPNRRRSIFLWVLFQPTKANKQKQSAEKPVRRIQTCIQRSKGTRLHHKMCELCSQAVPIPENIQRQLIMQFSTPSFESGHFWKDALLRVAVNTARNFRHDHYIWMIMTTVAGSIFRPLSHTHISKRVYHERDFKFCFLDIQLTLLCVFGVDLVLPVLRRENLFRRDYLDYLENRTKSGDMAVFELKFRNVILGKWSKNRFGYRRDFHAKYCMLCCISSALALSNYFFGLESTSQRANFIRNAHRWRCSNKVARKRLGWRHSRNGPWNEWQAHTHAVE